MKRLSALLALLMLVTLFVQAQPRQVTGTVTGSDDGMPLPGVSIQVKGTTSGGSTDMDGKFSLNVPANAKILVFSFVGYKAQEVEIGDRSIVNVILETESLKVEEVVVTALGITREKKSLGYSVQEVKGSDITKGGNPDIVTSLQGKVAGLEIRQSSGMPGAPAQILIRGSRSFDGNNTPLYVIDGMPVSSNSDYSQGSGGTSGAAYSSRSMDIDPSDIESVNILKGQAAAALYGMKATNGVVLITTKSGKKSAKGKPTVTFNSNYTVDRISRLPELQQTYAQGSYGKWGTASSLTWGPKIADLPKASSYLTGQTIYAGDVNGHPGQWFHPQKGQWVDPIAYNSAKEFFDDGVTMSNSINISQAGELGNYSIGLSSTNQSGIVSSTGMDRYTAKVAGNYSVNKKVNTGFTANYSESQLSKLPSGNDSYLFTVFGAPANYDLMGTPYYEPSGIAGQPDGNLARYRQTSYRRGAVGENPLWAIANNHNLEATKRFFGNAYLEYKPNEWLRAKYQLGIDTYTSNYDDYIEMGSSHTGQSLPTRTQYPTPSNPNYTYVEPTGGQMDIYGLTRRTINSLLTVTMSKQITEDIKGSFLIGNEITDSYVNDYSITGTGFVIPGWKNLSNTTSQVGDASKNRERTFGTFGNLSVDYRNMLFFNATGRMDVVSMMPRDNRSFFYPSVSLGFLFTELDALKGNSYLSFGKIRGSYAEVGQAGEYHPVRYYSAVGSSGFLSDGVKMPLGGVSGFTPGSRLYAADLKPMNTQTYELGVELKFFNNRVGLDYTYSNQLATDQIFAVPMAGSTGKADIVKNAGEMKSISHEVVVYLTPIQTTDFEWNVNINYSKTVSTCESLADGVTSIFLGGYEEPNIRASAGDTYPVIYGNRLARDAKGRILVDEDPSSPYYGMPYQGEFGKLGDVSPDFTLGVNNSFRYKFITISGLIDWKQGGKMYSGSNRLIDFYGTSKNTEDRTSTFIYPGFKADGTPNDIVRGGVGDEGAVQDLYADVLTNISEAYIMETSFVKLREISIGIDLPKKYIAPLKLQGANISFNARNILLWTPYDNFDPESSQGQGNMQGGMDYMSLPQTMSFGFGLNLTF